MTTPRARPAPARAGAAARVLVVGVGNVLRGDDMFGVEVARLLQGRELPPSVTVVETGIAGISLVQELLTGYDALLILDAVERQQPPGTLVMLEPHLRDPRELTDADRREFSSDLHTADPSRGLMMAKALGCLPAQVRILGCQVDDCDELLVELTPAVRDALPAAVQMVLETLRGWLGDKAWSKISR